MGILTALFIVMLAWAIYHFIPVLLKKEFDFGKTKTRLKHIKTIGSFSLVTGILGQLIGLYGAFEAIESSGAVSQTLLVGGLKISMITTLYGIIIFLISLFLWFIFDYALSQKTE